MKVSLVVTFVFLWLITLSSSVNAQSPSGIQNGSFESPPIATYAYRPSSSWTFIGNAGIQHNGSPWGAPNAPDGVQTAFLQCGSNPLGNGTISQVFTVPADGTYSISFYSALRAYRTSPTLMSFNVTMDGTNIGSFSPTSTAFSQFTTSQILLTAGSHTLSFVGTGTAPDTSDFIDFVTLNNSSAQLPPSNTAPPTITGTPQVGQTLTGAHGSWTNTPTSYTDQWYRAGVPISGATALAYSPQTADVGSTLTLGEVATNFAGSSTQAMSAATAPVTAPSVPVNISPPAITGTPQVGLTLTGVHGSWTNSPTSYADQWYRAGVPISGATALTYSPQTADVGLTLTLREIAINAAGSSAEAMSAATAPVTSPPAQTSAYYVSPNGNDSNSGTSTIAPFKTLDKAASAMRLSNIKTTYVGKGTYNRTTTLILTSADNGETWSYYPPDGYNTAILDYTGMTYNTSVNDAYGDIANTTGILINGGNNITINGLQVQNVPGGIAVHGGSADAGWGAGVVYATTGNAYNNTIENNIVHHLTYVPSPTTTPWPNYLTGIQMHGAVQNGKILNNVVYDAQSQGISAGVGNGPNNGANNLDIEGNVVYNVNQSPGDSGGICLEDRGPTQGPAGSTGIIIKNNFVRDVSQNGVSTHFNRCYYFDDYSSNITMTQNICTGTWNVGVQYHGSNNIVVSSNIFDYTTSAAYAAIFNYDPLPLQGMTGNTFTGNIIINGGSVATGNGYQTGGGAPTYAFSAPLIENNLYYSYGAASIYYGGAYSGTHVVSSVEPGSGTGDPYPVTGQNPSLSGWTYVLAPGSPAYSSPVNFRPIPGNWGPPGYVIPQTGNPPSSPH